MIQVTHQYHTKIVLAWNPRQALSWNPRHAKHQREILSWIPRLFSIFVSRIPRKQQNSLPVHCNDPERTEALRTNPEIVPK